MSLLDTLGGASSGLGMAGGMGSSPGDTVSSSAASTATIRPETTVEGVGGTGARSWGPFNIAFPGAAAQPSDAINRAPLSTSLGFNTTVLWYGLAAVAVVFLAYYLRK